MGVVVRPPTCEALSSRSGHAVEQSSSRLCLVSQPSFELPDHRSRLCCTVWWICQPCGRRARSIAPLQKEDRDALRLCGTVDPPKSAVRGARFLVAHGDQVSTLVGAQVLVPPSFSGLAPCGSAGSSRGGHSQYFWGRPCNNSCVRRMSAHADQVAGKWAPLHPSPTKSRRGPSADHVIVRRASIIALKIEANLLLG